MTGVRILVATLVLTAAAGGLTAGPQVPASQAQADSGRTVYERWCVPCHYRLVTPAPLLERALSPERIAEAVRKGVFVMPRFRKTEVSDADLAALTAYLAGRKG